MIKTGSLGIQGIYIHIYIYIYIYIYSCGGVLSCENKTPTKINNGFNKNVTLYVQTLSPSKLMRYLCETCRDLLGHLAVHVFMKVSFGLG